MQSWTVSDALWSKVEPLIPVSGRPVGRKRKDARLVFSAIVYVLRTGCQWKALPRAYGSASSVHKYFQIWHRAGF
jgi:transposase